MWLSADYAPNERAPDSDFWYYPVGQNAAGGVRVNVSTALAVPAIFACALVMGQTMGTVPVHLHRRLKRGKERAVDHPLYNLIHRRPNPWQTAFQWRQMMQWHLMLRYNAYSRIVFDRAAMPRALVPMHPDKTEVVYHESVRDLGASYHYRYQQPDGSKIDLTRDEVFHVRGLSSDGVQGFSPLEVQKDSISEAIAAQRYSGRRMKNDARPGGVLEWDGHFATDDDRKAFRRSWHEAQGGINAGKTAVLEHGMQWKEIGVKNTDLQYIELRDLKGYDIAMIHRMPPHKIGLLKYATFSNIEHQGIEFVTDTVLPWAVNWEQELSAQLLTDDEQEELFFEFMLEGLLRGDSRTRAEYYNRRFQMGSMAPNDIREAENENPIPGGDRYFVPVNMVALDRVDDQLDAKTTPPAAPAPAPEDGGGEEEKTDEERQREEDEQAAEAGGVVRREVAQLRRKGSLQEASAFYVAHIEHVAERMKIDEAVAREYCFIRAASFERAYKAGEHEQWIASLEQSGVHELLQFARAARA